jgi:DNA-binding response OmpR family regulator
MSALCLEAADLDRAGVLVVDADEVIRRDLATILESRGARVVEAGEGAAALLAFHREKPDVVTLRVGCADGWEVLRRLREESRRPVLTLAMSTDESTPVRALQCGADDHLRIPFTPTELIARLAVLVRWSRLPSNVETRQVYSDEQLEIDFATVEVRGTDGRHVRLPPLEYRLLAALVLRPGEVLGPEQLAVLVWNDHAMAPERLKAVVQRLRAHLRAGGVHPSAIEAVGGQGYRYRPAAAD